jgi:triosephosphate isomerase
VTAGSPRPLVVGNWKMNLGESAAVTLASALRETLPFDRVDAAIAPSFPCLRAVLDAVAGSPLAVGAQNMHWEAKGAFTGEVAPSQLVDMGVRYVIVGHSERRTLFGETDAAVARKVVAAKRHGLAPIVCVGESDDQRDAGRTREIVVGQVRAALAGEPVGSPDDLVVAYEPVWAIGTGKTPRPDDVTNAHAAIRAALEERFGAASAAIRILYGGSVTAANAPALLRAEEVGGALVGGASLEASSFRAIAAAAASC